MLEPAPSLTASKAIKTPTCSTQPQIEKDLPNRNIVVWYSHRTSTLEKMGNTGVQSEYETHCHDQALGLH